MIKKYKTNFKELHPFLILWSTQSLSSLGSNMTSSALLIWSYQQHGSALITSLLAICTYTPYILFSIFAGALSDRWNKKVTMLLSDSFAALCTISVLLLLSTGKLSIWHLCLINALTGLMNTVQQPAADVTTSLLTPQKHYQKVSGLRSLTNSLVTTLTPIIATALLSFAGIRVVILFDLITFAIAFLALLFFVKIPEITYQDNTGKESVLQSALSGLRYLKNNRGILDLILFLAVINFTANIHRAILPAMLLSRDGGGKLILGLVQTVMGIATMLGSIIVTFLPAPKSRVRVILNCLLFSMGTENFILAFGRNVPMWCFGAILGWIFIPVMSANVDVLMRTRIPIEMQGRVYSTRNSLQFFTVPLGYLCGGFLTDKVFEPFMAAQSTNSLWITLFGEGKGSGAALFFLVIGIFGALSCLPFRACKSIWRLEK